MYTIVLNVKTKKNNLCTQHVLSLYFSCNSMNNLLSCDGLIDARIRASDKDLPVLTKMAEVFWVIEIKTLEKSQFERPLIFVAISNT